MNLANVDQEKLYQLYVSEGKSVRTCAEILGKSKSSLNTYLRRLGWSRPNKTNLFKTGISCYREIAYQHHPNECFHCSSVKNLRVHHMDRNRHNNNWYNLRIVCQKCHINIEHYDSILKRKKAN